MDILQEYLEGKRPFSPEILELIPNQYVLEKIREKLLREIEIKNPEIEFLKEFGKPPIKIKVPDKGWEYDWIKKVKGEYLFAIPIFDFLRVKTHLKLSNLLIGEGYVFLSINELKEYVKSKKVNDILKNVKFKPQKIEVEGTFNSLKEIYDILPPCIKNLVDRAYKGEDLNHMERLVLAFFLINTNLPIDSIVEVYSHLPNFDEKKTRYFLEHASGLRGARKKYKPYNCDKMKVFGLCVQECGVKNPIVLFTKNLKSTRTSKPQSGSKKQPS